MTKIQLEIIKAVSTVFFQEGFDRESNKHGLEYWKVNDEDLGNHCRQCVIYHNDEEGYKCFINTTYINNQWFLRVCDFACEEYNEPEVETLLLIPVDTERLCWEVFTKCVSLIESVIPKFDY